MSRARASLIWLGALVALLVLLYLLRGVLLPFVVGIASAYFLDPAADRLERWGASRLVATSIITAVFLLVVAALVVLLVPLLHRQVLDLVDGIPGYAAAAKQLVAWLADALKDRLSPEDLAGLKKSVSGFAGDALRWLGGVLGRIWSGGLALFQVLTLVFVTPVVTFYMINDWDRIVAAVDGWVPPRHRKDARTLAKGIDRRLSGFLRGQALVCLALGLFYAVALSLAGLKFGLLVGIVAGLLAFIPFVGATIGFVVAVGLALVQFDGWVPVAVVGAIFLAGQVLEGNFLQPKLVGDRVGLHPVWIIFAVFAGGALLGLLGVILAVPLAAVLGELVRFGHARYLTSPLYTGTPEPPPRPRAARKRAK